MSSLFVRTTISVGASGALFGLLGAMLSELLINWTIYENKVSLLHSTRRVFAFFPVKVVHFSFQEGTIAHNLLFFLVCSPVDSRPHHHYQSSSWNPPPCGQLCTSWRICDGIFTWIYSPNPSSVWMGKPKKCSSRLP